MTSINQYYPLKPVMERTSPVEYLPNIDDPDGDGERLLAIMGRMKIPSGRGVGETFEKVSTPFQKKLVRTIGAGYATGLINELFLSLAKKNGKTTFSGMLMVSWCLAFPEKKGSIILLAKSQKQADLAYDVAATCIESDPFLMEQFLVRRYRSDILHTETSTMIKAIAAEESAAVGTIAHCYLVDEVHLIGSTPKGSNLIRQLSSGGAAREKSFGIYLTTAPLFGVVGSAFYSQILNRSRRILDGKSKAEEKLLPVLFELPREVEHGDSSQWWRANPVMGQTVSMEWLQHEYNVAVEDPDPTALGHFLAQHLNVQATELMGVDTWFSMADWDAHADQSITLKTLLERCGSVWLGLDAGLHDDPSAMVVLGQRNDDHSKYLIWSRQWLHTSGYNKRRKHNDYDTYIKARELVVVEADGGDLDGIMQVVSTIEASDSQLVCVGYDQHKLQELVERLDKLSITTLPIPQGWRMSKYLMAADRMLYENKLSHPGSPMLRWNVSNGQLISRGEAVALVKPQDIGVSKFKIDGLACVVMAIAASIEEKPIEVDWWIG